MVTACPSCGGAHEPGARFCSACGAALARACIVCGAEQSAGASFCSACGAAVDAGPGSQRASLVVSEHRERRIVTVLFADLAGSTALAERLDPEDVRAVQEELYGLVAADVERFGGVTEKFVGDAVLAVFGAPLAHDDDPERAVRAALALRDRFAGFAEAVRRRHGVAVGLRVGIDTGRVVAGRAAVARGELMVSGDAVNVAARLQQRAEPGQVLVGRRTHAVTRRAIAYRTDGARPARGKAEPVEAWEALRVVAGPGRRVLDGLSAPLIGRDEELGILRSLAARVDAEHALQLVTLFGVAGVGKSRLLVEYVASRPGTALLAGRCLPYGDGITFWPLAEVAKERAGVLESDAVTAALDKLTASVAEVVPPERAGPVVRGLAWTLGLELPSDSARRPSGSLAIAAASRAHCRVASASAASASRRASSKGRKTTVVVPPRIVVRPEPRRRATCRHRTRR